MKRRRTTHGIQITVVTICLALTTLGPLAADENPGVNAGYDLDAFNGFYIRSADEKFSLRVGAFTQIRWNLNYRLPPSGEEALTSGFDVNRTRFFFEGNYTPQFDYHFQFNIDSDGALSIWTAKFQVNFKNQWNLAGGLLKMPQSREDWVSPQDTLTTESSPNDVVFAIGSAFGLVTDHTGERMRFWAGVTNGNYGFKYVFPKNLSETIGVYGRWEIQAAGEDWSSWNDLVGRREREFGVLFGIAGGYQNALRTGSSTGEPNNGQVNIDVSVSGNGYQIMAAASWTYAVQDPLNASAAYSTNNFGFLVQGGVFVAPRHQIYAQYNLVSPGIDPGRFVDFNSLTFGYSFFPSLRSNRWKFSAEAGYLFDAINDTLVPASGNLGYLASDEPGQVYARIQTQFGF